MFGYAMNVIAVPALAFAGNWQMAALLVVAERTGKALRGPARDVLLSEATEKVGHGFGFGLHSIMDQTGAVIGPLMMLFAVARSRRAFRSGVPVAGGARGGNLDRADRRAGSASHARRVGARIPARRRCRKCSGTYVAAAGLLAFGYVDFPLLAVHFENQRVLQTPVHPAALRGRHGRERPHRFHLRKNVRPHRSVGAGARHAGFAAVAAARISGRIVRPPIASIGCWAAGLGAQDASLRSGIAQVVSMNKRGSAFGAFNGVFGVMWFLGSVAMGLLYDAHSLYALVALGVAAQLAAAVMFLFIRAPLAQAAARR